MLLEVFGLLVGGGEGHYLCRIHDVSCNTYALLSFQWANSFGSRKIATF